MKSLFKNKQASPEIQDFPVLPVSRWSDTVAENLLDALPQLICTKTRSQRLFCNQAMRCYTGTLAIEMNDPEFWQLYIHPEDHEYFLAQWFKGLSELQHIEITCRIKDSTQQYHWFSISAVFPAMDHELEWLISCTDIDDQIINQQKLAQQISAQTQMLDASVDCIKLLSQKGQVISINQPGRQALGISHDVTSFGMPWLNLLAPHVRKNGQRALQAAAQGKKARFDGVTQVENGNPQYWDNILTPILNHEGLPQNILCVSRDVSEQRITAEKLHQLNERDDLTGLYNRRAFKKLLSKTLQQSKRNTTSTALLLLDLDYFKHINDAMGYVAGDHLLRVLGKRLKNCLDSNAYVSRLGSDEFSIILPETGDDQDILNIAAKLQKQLDLPIRYNGQFLNGSMSIGYAVYPRDAKDSSALLKCADIALNNLKSGGRGGIQMFSQSMLDVLEESARQLILARQLIRDNSIFPFYQPKVRLKDKKLVGFEALLRWHDEHGDVQLPSRIYKSFQDYDLATRISEKMQTSVFQDIAQWLKQDTKVLPVSINAAPVEFLRDNYAETLLKRMQFYKIPPELIEIEITELSLAEGGASYVIRALNLLKKAGLRISLDDFGTGHSSLTRLKDYPVDCLKIDRSFVVGMQNDPSILAIVRAISQLGPGMSLDILAEGIEVTEQLNTLIDCDCHIGQGFYFYQPMSSSDALQLLQKN
jgi:diguanylate cyclase (GGDEF)-like protein